jgi:hypothetical protein
MKNLFCILIMLLAGVIAQAHPGIGIVQDSRGNIFYTDLKQVWKITPDGKKSVVVPNVHTHELCLDREDNLYGEHLWYEGDATKKWGHRVWCLKPDGTALDVIPAREGFLKDYSFIRDRSGNMYWADRSARTTIKKRSPDGKITIHAVTDFRDVGWMTVSPDGHLFLINKGSLHRVAPDGEITAVADNLSERQPAPAKASNRYYHMGQWLDANGNVYVAVPGERLVLQIGVDGSKTIVARSSGRWSPSGGMIDRNGDLWLLEYSTTNEVRVRQINRNGREQVF